MAEARVAALEENLTQLAQQLTGARQRENQLDEAVRQLQESAAASLRAVPPRAAERERKKQVIDTRNLGKPEVYGGDASKWRDWKVLLTTYATLLDQALIDGFAKAEAAAAAASAATTDEDLHKAWATIENVSLEEDLELASRNLH